MSVRGLHMKALKENLADESLKFDSSDWLTTCEAAEYLRIFTKDGKPSSATIRNLVNQGRIPFYKPYGRLLFKRSELETLIENSRKGVLDVHR